MSLVTQNLKIENVFLGQSLVSIKEGQVPIYKPEVITSSITLTPSQFVNSVTEGLLVDCTTSSKTITFPNAADVISMLKLKKYDIFLFSVTNIGSSPFTNTLTLVSSPSISFGKNVPTSSIANGATLNFNCVCYNNTNSPKIIVNF